MSQKEFSFEKYNFLNNPIHKGDSSVFKATNKESPNAPCLVIKTYSNQFLKTNRKQKHFENELKALTQLKDKEHIVQLRNHVNKNDTRYLVLQYCDFGTLQTEMIKNEGPFSQARSIQIIKQIISGYRHIHQANILHRNLSPENILSIGLQFKISDFSDSVPISQAFRCSQLPLNNFQAPQVISSHTFSRASDIYSIGAIFYYMLNGEAPYKGTSRSVILKKMEDGCQELSLPTNLSFKTIEFIGRAITQVIQDRFSPQELFEFEFEEQVQSNTSFDQKNLKKSQINIQMSYQQSMQITSNKLWANLKSNLEPMKHEDLQAEEVESIAGFCSSPYNSVTFVSNQKESKTLKKPQDNQKYSVKINHKNSHQSKHVAIMEPVLQTEEGIYRTKQKEDSLLFQGLNNSSYKMHVVQPVISNNYLQDSEIKPVDLDKISSRSNILEPKPSREFQKTIQDISDINIRATQNRRTTRFGTNLLASFQPEQPENDKQPTKNVRNRPGRHNLPLQRKMMTNSDNMSTNSAIANWFLAYIDLTRFIKRITYKLSKSQYDPETVLQLHLESLSVRLLSQVRQLTPLDQISKAKFQNSQEHKQIIQILTHYQQKTTTNIIYQQLVTLSRLLRDKIKEMFGIVEKNTRFVQNDVKILDYLVSMWQFVKLLSTLDIKQFSDQARLEDLLKGSQIKLTMGHMLHLYDKLKKLRII